MTAVGIEKPSRARQHPLDSLYQPFTLKSLELPNRVAMAPMTRGFCQEEFPDPTSQIITDGERRMESA
jgi:2,4-dienoyl-CoA reductase-like NADH-dependent reductase (Old Yellow Enzyme family)